MTILSSILINSVPNTASLTMTFNGNPVETYNFANNQITVSGRPNIVISGVDFLDMINQINIFQTALLANFPINVFTTIPFDSTTCTEQNDELNNLWNFAFLSGIIPRFANYSANGSNKTVDLLNRGNSKTLEFPEWISCLTQLNHYKSSIKSFLNI